MSNSFDWSSALGGIGSIGAALIGGAMSSHAAGKQFKYNAWLQKQASKLNIANTKLAGMFNIKSNALIPYYQRQGLERAGYNPMLAVQNGVSGSNVASTSGVPGGSVDAPDYNGGIASGIANVLNFKRLQNETLTAESSANLNNEQAQTEESKRINLYFDSMMKDAQKHLADKDLSWYDRRVNAEIYRNMQEAEQRRAEASVVAYNSETQRIIANATKLQAETSSKWTPVGIGANLGAGLLGFTLGKIPGLKYLKKPIVGFH